MSFTFKVFVMNGDIIAIVLASGAQLIEEKLNVEFSFCIDKLLEFKTALIVIILLLQIPS